MSGEIIILVLQVDLNALKPATKMKVKKELWSVFIFVFCHIGCNGTFLYNTLTHLCIGRGSSVDSLSAPRASSGRSTADSRSPSCQFNIGERMGT